MYQTFDHKSSFSRLTIKVNSKPASADRGAVQVELESVVVGSWFSKMTKVFSILFKQKIN